MNIKKRVHLFNAILALVFKNGDLNTFTIKTYLSILEVNINYT